MKRIALKIDVDTCRGTLSGVPKLIELLQRHDARATFFFSLGPDRSGHDTGVESLARFHDRSNRLYSRLLPATDIGIRGAEIMRRTQDAGFEAGIHAWDRAGWEQRIGQAENTWVEGEMRRAGARFAEIFPGLACAHAAAGWRMNRHALRMTQRLGFAYASDCRGTHPFLPVIDGELIACPQLPTTLPTLDEVFTVEPALSPAHAADRIVHLARTIPGDHVFTLRAEVEGLLFPDAFERLIEAWLRDECRLVPLHDLYSTLDQETLPRHVVQATEIPGRRGLRLTQGAQFPHGS